MIRKIGWVLLGLGVALLVIGLVKVRSKREVFRVGGFHASTTAERAHPKLTYAGVGMAVVGGLMVFGGSRRSGKH
jgi:hypothetical protein